MGYYIQTPGFNTGKVEKLLSDHSDAFVISQPSSFEKVPEKMGLICVVENGLFDAAAYCYNEQEFSAFCRPDDYRPKTWMLMPKELAERLSGFNKGA